MKGRFRDGERYIDFLITTPRYRNQCKEISGDINKDNRIPWSFYRFKQNENGVVPTRGQGIENSCQTLLNQNKVSVRKLTQLIGSPRQHLLYFLPLCNTVTYRENKSTN